MSELSGLTDADIRKIRDMSRRINAGAGSQRSHHKRRRGRQGGGSSGGGEVNFYWGIVVQTIPGASPSAESFNAGEGGKVNVFGLLSDANGTEERLKDDDDNPVQAVGVNCSTEEFKASTDSPIPVIGALVDIKDEDQTPSGPKKKFIVVTVMNGRAFPGFDLANPQALRHLANVGPQWGGKQCQT